MRALADDEILQARENALPPPPNAAAAAAAAAATAAWASSEAGATYTLQTDSGSGSGSGSGSSSSSGAGLPSSAHDRVQQAAKLKSRQALLRGIAELKAEAGLAPTMGMGMGLGLTRNSSSSSISSSSSKVADMDELRRRTVDSAAEAQRRAVLLVQEHARSAATQRINSLPAVCDTLRLHWLSKGGGGGRIARRSSAMMTHEVLNDLAPSLATSQSELLVRLQIIARELPEFLTLFPADDVVQVPTVQVNLHAPYADVRSKACRFVQGALALIAKRFATGTGTGTPAAIAMRQ
jgi:hypothetical protein